MKITMLHAHSPYLGEMNRNMLILAFMMVITACQKSPVTTSVRRENITESVYASGILKSQNQYEVYATVNGLLKATHVEEGDTIKKGQRLFTISNETPTLSKENAKLAAELANIKTNQGRLDELTLGIDLAKSRMINDSLLYLRQQNLWDQQIGSKVAFENARLNFENSKTAYYSAQLKYKDEKRRLEILSRQAQVQLAISQQNESDFTITSAIDGRVYALFKEDGEIVTPQTPLAIIGDVSSFVLELQVDEYDIVLIRPGQTVKVTMDSYRGEVYDAVVTKVYPLLNSRTKTALVEAQFKNQPPVLYPNLTLEANIILHVKENVLTIPRAYIMDDAFVININGDTLPIKTGAQDYMKTEILEGLSEHEILILPR